MCLQQSITISYVFLLALSFFREKYSRREVINMCIKLFPLWIVCPCAYPYVLQSRAVSRLCVCHGCDIGYWTFVWDIWRLWCPESNLYLLEHSDTYSASSTQWLLELDNAGWRKKTCDWENACYLSIKKQSWLSMVPKDAWYRGRGHVSLYIAE